MTVVPLTDDQKARIARMFTSRRAKLQCAEADLRLRLVHGPADERYCAEGS